MKYTAVSRTLRTSRPHRKGRGLRLLMAVTGDGRGMEAQRYLLTAAPPKEKGGGFETASKPPHTWEIPICMHKLTCPTTVFLSPIGRGQDRLAYLILCFA